MFTCLQLISSNVAMCPGAFPGAVVGLVEMVVGDLQVMFRCDELTISDPFTDDVHWVFFGEFSFA